MKLTVAQENLRNALALVSRAANNRTALPILSNVLMSVDGGDLVLACTDLAVGIVARIPTLKVEEVGITTVPVRTLYDLVNTMSGTISLETTKAQTLHMRVSGGKTDIKGIDASEFPPMPDENAWGGAAAAVTLSSRDFRDGVAQVAFCASTDFAWPVLTAVKLAVSGDTMKMEAADGFRLALKSIILDKPVAAPLYALVPATALVEAARIAAGADVRIIVRPGGGQVIFHTEAADLITQTVEGSYPDLGQVIPKEHKTRAVAERAALLLACKQAEIFAREGNYVVKLDINSGVESTTEILLSVPPHITVFGQSAETGQQEGTVDAQVEGNGMIIAFNVKYLRDILEAIPTPQVAIETNANSLPGVFKPVHDQAVRAGEEYFCVLMPMSLE